MKFIASMLLVFLMTLLTFISGVSLASSTYAEAEQIATAIATELTLDLSQLIFQGEIFSQATSAWQFHSEHGFGALLKALPKQDIIQQYHGFGNLIMLSGEYAQHSVLMHIERTGVDAYHGFLSVMLSSTADFSADEAPQLQHYLLSQQEVTVNGSALWIPQDAVLLLDIKSNPFLSQQIYLTPTSLDILQQDVLLNLTSLGWQKNMNEEMGLSVWTKGTQQLRLYFSQQLEGTALYVLTQDSTKEIYEHTHE